ncbi:MAG: hypothetical protein HKN26_01070 [Acidimicrobiales bacterium]|nr:hypothetical protein [Acidimicrobiales bacterium]
MTGLSSRVVLMISLLICGVGIVDALIGREWDLLVIFIMTALAQFLLLMRFIATRVPVTIRADLAQWVEDHSEHSGEPVEQIIDRSLAWYRQGLYRPTASDG